MSITSMMRGLLGRIVRSIERPSVPLSSGDDELFEMFGAKKTDSGVQVNRLTALRHAPLWRGVNLLARDTAKLPLLIYRRVGDGKERATEHPSFNLLRHKPNREMNSFTFRMTLTAHAILHGNGFAFISRRGDGSPDQLIPLLPDRTYPVRENGNLLYITSIGGTIEEGGTIRRLLPENVLHIKGLGFDGLCGYSLIEFGDDSIGLGMAQEKYGSRFFRNNARPSVVIEHPGSISEKAAKLLKDSWNALHEGLDNAHRTAVLEEGMKVHALSINARDAQLLDGMKFGLVRVANLLCVPVHKVGGEGRTSYNSLEMENQAYLDDGLDPWLVAWEEECRDKLLTEEEKRTDSHIVEFMRQALVRADLNTRGAYYAIGIQNKWLQKNEVRGKENMNPIEGLDEEKPTLDVALYSESALAVHAAVAAGTMPHESAKVLLASMFPQLTDDEISGFIDPLKVAPPPAPPTKPSAEPVTPEPQEDRTMDVHRELLVETISRACRRIGVWSRRAADNSKTFPDWLDGFRDQHREAVLKILDTPVRVCRKGTAAETADAIFDEIHRVLDECYSTAKPTEFASIVDARMAACETDFPSVLAAKILKGDSENGTPIPAD